MTGRSDPEARPRARTAAPIPEGVLDAARRVSAQGGWQATTMERIAEAHLRTGRRWTPERAREAVLAIALDGLLAG